MLSAPCASATPAQELPAPSSRQTKSKSRSKSLPQKDTDVPEAADNDPLAPLQEVPFVPTQQLEDYVHAVVWRVGRQFGYQAFNLNPSSAKHKSQQFVASTIFLASDHLVSLIVSSPSTHLARRLAILLITPSGSPATLPNTAFRTPWRPAPRA